jgi:hypothetical protein
LCGCPQKPSSVRSSVWWDGVRWVGS